MTAAPGDRSRRTGRRTGLALLLPALLVLIASRTGLTHDAEHTAVELTLAADGSFVLDVANDPNWLLLRLEPFAADAGLASHRSSSIAPMSPADRDRILAGLAPIFRDRVVLWVDGREVRPESSEYLVPRAMTAADETQPSGVFRLRGRMSPTSRTLRWFYGIVVDEYPMTVLGADGRATKETVLGNAWSETIDLAERFAAPSIARWMWLGARQVVVERLEYVLFIAGVALLAGGVRSRIVEFLGVGAAQACGVALSSLGLWRASPEVLMPAIGLSLAYVVAEMVLARGPTRARTALLCVFAVCYGVKAASAFTLVSAPAVQVIVSAAAFTAGALSAQALVFAAVLAIALTARRLASVLGRWPARRHELL